MITYKHYKTERIHKILTTGVLDSFVIKNFTGTECVIHQDVKNKKVYVTPSDEFYEVFKDGTFRFKEISQL